MPEPRNGLVALLRAWPIITTVFGMILALVAWQFLPLKATVDALVKEQDRRTVAVGQVPMLQEEVKHLRLEMVAKAIPMAVLDTRLTNIERDIQAMRGMFDKLREDLMRGRRLAPGPEPF